MATLGEKLVASLARRGVDTVFGIPGNHTTELYRGLADSGIRHVSPRHEQGAGFMADGYARASGRPGVCFLISGPGLTNALTPVMQALADSVPMLVITAVAARHQLGMGEGRLHELPDQHALAAQCFRFSHTLMRADELPKVLAKAFAVFASARPGPVHIELPLDVITSPADHVEEEPWPSPMAPVAHPQAVAEAARWLRAAARPCLLVGGGVAAAPDAVARLAEALQMPVVNTVNGKGCLPCSHPLAVGGSPSLPAVRHLLEAADVVLAAGTEFGETDYDMLFLGEPAFPGRLIRIDIDPAQLARNVRPDLALCGDAGATLSALAAALPAASGGSDWGVSRVAAARAAIRQEPHFHAEMQRFFETLGTALPGHRLVGDSTLPTYYAVWQYECEAPRSYFHSATGGGTLGYAIPAAIGAALAEPSRPTLALIGDGAAQFTLTEISAAVQEQVRVIFLVWDNRGYSEIRTGMIASDIAPVGVDIAPPDFIAMAGAMGCESLRCETHAALAQALRAAAERDGPSLVVLPQEHFISQPAGQWY